MALKDSKGRFMKGHLPTTSCFKKGQIAHNKGKTLEESYGKDKAEKILEQKKKNHWSRGPRRKEIKKRLSEVVKESYVSGERKPPMQNRKHTKKSRNQMSEKRKGRKNSRWAGEKNPAHGEEHKKARMNRIMPYRDSSIEVALQKELTNRNISFEKHKLVTKRHRCDLFIEPNVVIEADGVYWHNYPHGTARDKQLNIEMADAGYTVLRCWGSVLAVQQRTE